MSVLITRGSRVSVPEGGFVLRADPDGRITSSLTLHVSYEMYPQWLKIALDHARECELAAREVDRLWVDGSREIEIEALEAELRAAMQACISASAALDGFYGTLVELAPPPEAQRDKWRAHRTARYKQVSEVFRLATTIGPKTFKSMRNHLKGMFELRDEAIHPTGASRAPLPHPRLRVGTERRLAIFNAGNAVGTAESAINIIGLLLALPNPKKVAVVEHFAIAKDWVYPIAKKWESETGRQLFERPEPGT